jgi:hypothetical protein
MLRQKQNISRYERRKTRRPIMASPDLRCLQGTREKRAGAYRLVEEAAAGSETNQPLRAANQEPPLQPETPCYGQRNKTLRQRERGEDAGTGTESVHWTEGEGTLTCGGAGWSGGSESDEIRSRRGWDEMVTCSFRLGEARGLVSSQIRPGRSARRSRPRAGPFIAPVGSGHGRSGGHRRRIGFGRIRRAK